jgi:Sec-independent protein secretion pathway component TatC
VKQGAADIQSSGRPVFLSAVMWFAGALTLFVAAVYFDTPINLLRVPLDATMGVTAPDKVVFFSHTEYGVFRIKLAMLVTACILLPFLLTKSVTAFLSRRGIGDEEASWFRMRYTPLFFVAGALVAYFVMLPLWLELRASLLMIAPGEPPANAISEAIRQDMERRFVIDYLIGAMQTILIVGLGAQAAGMYLIYRKNRPNAQPELTVE